MRKERSALEDYLLIRKIKDGDTAAFEQLTRKYYDEEEVR